MVKFCVEMLIPVVVDAWRYSINGHITVSMTPTKIADEHPDFFMKRDNDGFLRLPTSHAYYAQVQGEMALLDVEWCDFVVFSNNTIVID